MINRVRNYKSPQRQQGVVIVVALFFVALSVTMAYFMMSRLERDTYRTRLLLRDTQAELYAEGSIDWAMEQLHANLVKRKANRPVDVIPIESPVNEVNGYRISSVIYDMQSRMNINNLTTDEAKLDFKFLLKIVDPKLDDEMMQALVAAIFDWITSGSSQNEYNQYYLSLKPPYRAAHRNMLTTSELLLVKGMTPALFQALQPYVTALPPMTQVNIRTAPAQVLAALTHSSLDTGKAIEKVRAEKVIADVAAFKQLDLLKNHEIKEDKITAISRYFLVETTVAIENQKVVLYTLLERNEGQEKLNVIWQSKSVPTT
jgi:general secretion pathway protein K